MRAWLLLGAGLLAAAIGLGWMSSALLRLDARARLSENSRLALWRMELALARLISTESTRPAADYARGPAAPEVLARFDVSSGGKVVTPEKLSDQLSFIPEILARARPLVVSNSDEGTRNGGEFNRRNFFAMNNLAAPEARESAMAPAWYDDKLVLARRSRMPDGIHVQGAWLHWEVLRESLLGEVKDLLPEAQLVPLEPGKADAMTLGSLPVRLIPGTPAVVDDPERTPIRQVIAAAWIALALVAFALGALLFGTLSLNERRAAFVSAVTHELRTPLTTFKLYAEMLEEGMVPADRQKEYLATLRQESNRLGYLVENVLAYSQIEKGRKKPLEALLCGELLERIIPRLASRAPGLVIGKIPEVVVQADRVSVEQILFNLVDNACKHGSREFAPSSAPLPNPLPQGGEGTFATRGRPVESLPAARAGIRLGLSVKDARLTISVSDDGPGVSPDVARKLFQPFRRSASEAADGAQGIGLGLALSRRLARAMGGDLTYRMQSGATFELSLVLPGSRRSRVTSA